MRRWWRRVLCALFGHRLVRPPCGGWFCTRCAAATDWLAYQAGQEYHRA